MKAYKIFQLQKSEWQQWLAMQASILRFIFFTQLVLIILACVLGFYLYSDMNRREHNHLGGDIRTLPIGGQIQMLLNQPAIQLTLYTTAGSFLLYPTLWPIIILLSRKQAKQFRNKTIRGATLIEPNELQKLLPESTDSIALTDDIMLPRQFENRHFLILGATGTGKSNCISKIIYAQKQRGVKAIVYDRKDGEFLSRFFNPKTDLVFNPFDSRSLYFNVLDGRQTDADFDALAANIIPSAPGKEKFFHDTARDILAGIFCYCFLKGTTTNADIWRLLTRDIPGLYRALRSIQSDAANYICNHSSGQTQGIISTLMQFAKIFKYLGNSNQKDHFSLHEWLNDSDSPGFIFLTNTTKQREALKGILSLFINCLADAVMSLPDDFNRRIFFFLDEFGTLQKMDAVKDLITLTRSKGCAFILGLQDKSLLNSIYERDIADTIVNNCNNYLIFRLNGYDNAKYMSDLLGQAEKDYSLALGSKDLSQGQAYRNLAKIDTLILPSQIQVLPDLHCYLKLHGHPSTKTKISYTDFPLVAPGFLPNADLLTPLQSKVETPSQTNKENVSTGSSDNPKEVERSTSENALSPQQNEEKTFEADDFDF